MKITFILPAIGKKKGQKYIKTWKNMDEKVIENRRRYLENYLQQVIDQCKRINNSPLNYRAINLPRMNRQCFYNFNTFFRISPMSDKNV